MLASLGQWWLELCLPPQIRDGAADDRLRGRLIVMVTTSFLVASFVLLVVHLAWGAAQTVVLLGAINATCIIGILILRLTGSRHLLAHFTGALWVVCSTAALLVRGGMTSPTVMAIAAAPVAVVFIGGRREGLIWGVVSIVAIVGFALLEQGGFIDAADTLPEGARIAVSAIVTTILVAITLGGVLALDAVYKAATAAHKATAARLHEAELKRVQAETEAQLAHADRMVSLGQLSAGVAHEINNPLAYIVSNLDFLRAELETLPRDEVMSALDDVHEGAMRVARIVGALKSFTRLKKAERRSMDLAKAARAAVELARPHTRHTAEVEVEVDGTPTVIGDEYELTQVFLNLLINAAQAAAPDRESRMQLTIKTGADRIVATVTDNGVGIHADDLRRVADPFYTTKPVGVGTGLGLSVCKGIVERHGGELAIDSELDEGTTVTIALPAAGAGDDGD